jgi:transposase-like protein
MNTNETQLSLPSIATRAAIAAVLDADPGLSPQHRARVLRTLHAPDGDPDRAAGWLPSSLVAAQLGIHPSSLSRWIQAGKVHSRKGMGERAVLVSAAEVASYAAAHPRANRGDTTATK